MTSSEIELTPGQRCLLDLLQRKLLSTVQTYSKLSCQKREHLENNISIDDLDTKLGLLKDRIRRLSARQQRFTHEIISGKGNNTIPKESFFEALGLLTKEALTKLNSKTKERRRRTTANPRFSHEAIQARRVVNSRSKPTPPSSQASQGKANSNQNNSQRSNASAQTPRHNNNNNNNSNNNNNNNQAAAQSDNHHRIPEELKSVRRELLQQYNRLQKQIDSKANQIKAKRQSNEKIAHQNELIRQDMMNMINTQIQWRCDESLEGLD